MDETLKKCVLCLKPPQPLHNITAMIFSSFSECCEVHCITLNLKQRLSLTTNQDNITFSLSFIDRSWACCSLCVNIFSYSWLFLSMFHFLLFLCIIIVIYNCEIFLETCPMFFTGKALCTCRRV